MSKTKIFLCLPILNESENIPDLLTVLKKQSFQNFELIACVNQPEEWWNDTNKVNQCFDNQKSIENHQKLSKKLSDFAKGVPEIVKNYDGDVIYAGGDDILAYGGYIVLLIASIYLAYNGKNMASAISFFTWA